MKNNKFLHNLAMGTILIGSFLLFFIAFWWYEELNSLMTLGMSTMALVALANFYLHLVKMKKR